MSTLRVVLLGALGHGKTFLFNKLTNADEAVESGGKSVTKKIVVGQAAHGEFEIVDTPGFGALEDKLLHAAGVIAALAQGDVNRILVLVKHERIEPMITHIKKVIGSLQRYKHLITIVVTHWDDKQSSIKEKYQSQESQEKTELKQKQDLEVEFKKFTNIGSVLFSSKQDDPIIITKQITNIILSSQFTKIQLQDSEIYSQFDLVNEGSEEEFNKLESQISKIKNKFRHLSTKCIDYIKAVPLNDNYLIEKLHYLSLYIKRIANEEIEKFEREYGDQMNETYDTDGVNIRYLHHIYLKKELRLDVEGVIKKAQAKMKESQNHCFNWIKQCPYCGLVWIKVVGCDNETTCGNRVFSNLDYLLINPVKQKRFKIVFTQKAFDIEVEDEKKDERKLGIQQQLSIYQILYNSVKDDPLFSHNFRIYSQNFDPDQIIVDFIIQIFGYERINEYTEQISELDSLTIINEFKLQLRENGWHSNEYENSGANEQKSLGCGSIIVWKDLPPLSGPLLEELLSPELLDYFHDQEQLLKGEADYISKELERTYKNLVNQAINEQLKNVKVLPKLQKKNVKQAQNDTENQEVNQQNENLRQNFLKHIEKTKIEQQNVQRRYSIRMNTDESFLSEAETLDNPRRQKPEGQH